MGLWSYLEVIYGPPCGSHYMRFGINWDLVPDDTKV